MDSAPTLYAYILAGGQGERLWPLSVSARPKQFLDLFGGEPLLVQTFRRITEGTVRANGRTLEGVVP